VLPEGVAPDAVADLARIESALAAAGVVTAGAEGTLVFDPFLVRGMGYYTGTIFEIEHPDFTFSLGGGGRYDGMIGRFLTESVPACGFSIGFERIIDLVDDPAAGAGDSVALVHDKAAEPERLLRLKRQLVGEGRRVRLERRTKNLGPLLERLSEAGFSTFAQVGRDTVDADELEFKTLGA
jgi:histidyl-tRNA synthetase